MSVDRERTVVTKFDRALVGRWFGLMMDSRTADDGDRHPLIWAVTPSPGERNVLASGAIDIGVAIEANVLPTARPAPAELTAALLQEYLAGVAAGIAGVGRSLSGPAAYHSDGTDRGLTAGEPAGASGEGTDRLALVAGLIAGAAAVQLAAAGTRDGSRPESAAAQGLPWSMPGPSASTPGQTWPPTRPSAADIARAAGTAAAELVVDGAGLHDIAAAAAQSATRGWSVGGPGDQATAADRRIRTLVAQVLLALERAARPAAAAAEPASCGAGPGHHLGSEFRAEVTFVVFTSDSDAARLRADLEPLADEVVIWSNGDRREFHVHTRDAAEVVSQAYAMGTVFALSIGALEGC